MASCWSPGRPGAGPTISSWPWYSSRILRSSATFAAVAASTRASLAAVAAEAEAVMVTGVTIKCLLLGLGRESTDRTVCDSGQLCNN